MNRLMSGCALALTILTTSSVYAAESDIEEVIVTGSYIRTASEDAASPVDVTTREDLNLAGNPSLGDIMGRRSERQ